MSGRAESERPTLPPGVAAKVGGTEISAAHVRGWTRAIDPDGAATAADKVGALQVVAVNAWVEQEAKRRGITVTPTEVAETHVGAPAGAPRADVAAFRHREALLNKMADQHAGPTPRPTPAQVEQAAEELRDTIARPEARTFFEIASHSKADVVRARELIRSRHIVPAEAVARFSDDPQLKASEGFSMGVVRADLRPDISTIVFGAETWKPTAPQKIDGRWRTWVVTETDAGMPAPPMSTLRRSAKQNLSAGVHDARAEKEREELLRQAAQDTVCAPAFYVKDACGRQAAS